MKKKDLIDLKNKSLADLGKKLLELEGEKLKSQIELKMGKVKNVHISRQFKREIAKIKTIIKLKQLSQMLLTDKQQKVKNVTG